MKKLSIIIPVYNGEKFIKRCLDSVLSNKCDKEIIVINDCSSDSSLNILKEYGNKIVLVDLKENHGVSYARNLGIKKSSGDFITFVDIDDYIDSNMYPLMLSYIDKYHSDVCVCNYNEIFEDKNITVKSKYNFSFKQLNGDMALKNFLIDNISPAIWDKIYSKELIRNMRFDDGLSVGEDFLFCLNVFISCSKVAFVNNEFYHYVQQNLSVMHTISPKLLQFKEIINNISIKDYKMLEKNYFDEFGYFKLQMITRSIHSISMLINKNNKDKGTAFLRKCYNKSDLKNIIKCKYFSKSVKLEMLILLIFGIRFHLMLMPLYKFIRSKRR